MLALGTLLWAAPALAQPSRDPLAPLPTPSTTAQQVPSSAVQPMIQAQPAPVAPAVTVPRDWRGVFDAIDSGNWASAQAGIAVLPRSVLTPVAQAELYTAKGSPVVDLSALQAVIAEAPELPEANQLGLMALKRGATTPPLVVPEKPVLVLGSAPVRYRAHPVQGEPAADSLRSALDALV
jgi:soluble lytic murein transglycosylase